VGSVAGGESVGESVNEGGARHQRASARASLVSIRQNSDQS